MHSLTANRYIASELHFWTTVLKSEELATQLARVRSSIICSSHRDNFIRIFVTTVIGFRKHSSKQVLDHRHSGASTDQ